MTDLATLAAEMCQAERYLAGKLGRRWIMGTGFVHREVGTMLIKKGVAEAKDSDNGRQIRATPLGLELRAYLERGR